MKNDPLVSALTKIRQIRQCNAITKNGPCRAITNNILCANGKWRCKAHAGLADQERNLRARETKAKKKGET